MSPRPATFALLVFFAVTTGFFCLFAPRFFTASNIENLMSGFSFVAILAVGQAFPILMRGIDLSIGAIVALTGMVAFDLTLIFHVPGYLVLPIALFTASAAGAINGLLIVGLRLQKDNRGAITDEGIHQADLHFDLVLSIEQLVINHLLSFQNFLDAF